MEGLRRRKYNIIQQLMRIKVLDLGNKVLRIKPEPRHY